MAYVTTHSPDHFSDRGLRQSIAGFFRSFQQAIEATSEIESLNCLSDDALALRGLTRQEIPAHVSARYFGIGASS